MSHFDNLTVVHNSYPVYCYLLLVAFDINLPDALLHSLIFPEISLQPTIG